MGHVSLFACRFGHQQPLIGLSLHSYSGLSLFLYAPHRPIRAIALFYPVLILLVIMVSSFKCIPSQTHRLVT